MRQRCCDADAGKEAAVLKGHTNAAFSPDGKCIVTASHGNTKQLWEIPADIPEYVESTRRSTW
jgi:WD40 repeat protein